MRQSKVGYRQKRIFASVSVQVTQFKRLKLNQGGDWALDESSDSPRRLEVSNIQITQMENEIKIGNKIDVENRNQNGNQFS